MRKTSVRELHEHTGALVSEAAEGQIIVIHKRGVPVAELRPARHTKRPKGFLDNEAFLAQFPQVPTDSGRYFEEERS